MEPNDTWAVQLTLLKVLRTLSANTAYDWEERLDAADDNTFALGVGSRLFGLLGFDLGIASADARGRSSVGSLVLCNHYKSPMVLLPPALLSAKT